MTSRKYIRQIAKHLEDHGVKLARIEKRSKHLRVVWTDGGKEVITHLPYAPNGAAGYHYPNVAAHILRELRK